MRRRRLVVAQRTAGARANICFVSFRLLNSTIHPFSIEKGKRADFVIVDVR